MTISHLIEGRDGVVSCTADTTVREAIAMLSQNRIGAMPVIQDNHILGVFSERDVIYNIQKQGADALDLTMTQVMTADVVTVTPDTSIIVALSMMTRRRIRHLPVVKDGAMIGFVSIGDLVKYRIDIIEHEAAAMRDYIQMA